MRREPDVHDPRGWRERLATAAALLRAISRPVKTWREIEETLSHI